MQQIFLSNLATEKMENEFNEFLNNHNWNDIKPQLSQAIEAVQATSSVGVSGRQNLGGSGVVDGDHRLFPPLAETSTSSSSSSAQKMGGEKPTMIGQQPHGQILNKQLLQPQTSNRIAGIDLMRSIYQQHQQLQQQQQQQTSGPSLASSSALPNRDTSGYMRQQQRNDASFYDTNKLIQRIVSDSANPAAAAIAAAGMNGGDGGGNGGGVNNNNNKNNNVPSQQQQNTRFNLCDTNNVRNNSDLQMTPEGVARPFGPTMYGTNVNGSSVGLPSSNSASTSSAGSMNERTVTADSTSPPPSLSASPAPLLPPESPLNNTNTSINSSEHEKKTPNSIRGRQSFQKPEVAMVLY
jgi:hypothetical protein